MKFLRETKKKQNKTIHKQHSINVIKQKSFFIPIVIYVYKTRLPENEM